MAVSLATAVFDADHLVTYVSGGSPVTVARTLPVVVFAPNAPGTYPVVVFSHGHGGAPVAGVAAIASAMADLGYIVIAPTHLDSLAYSAAISDQFQLSDPVSSLHRVADMQLALDRAGVLAAQLPGGGYGADLTRVAVVGHSHGAFTAALLAGAMPTDAAYVLAPTNSYGMSSLADARIDAAVMLSPQGVESDWAALAQQSWDGLQVPVLAMTGTLDYELGTASWSTRLDFMRHADSGPLYAVVFQGMDHRQIGGNGPAELTASMASISDTFLDAFLWSDPAALAAIASPSGLLASSPLAAAAFERAGVGLGGSVTGSGVVRGQEASEYLFGLQTDDVIVANGGNDILVGGFGSDLLDGAGGSDTADYSTSSGGVTVDLSSGSASGGDAAGDALLSIENLIGSGSADVLTGDGGANALEGGAGDDQLNGGGGVDTASYRSAPSGVAVSLATAAAQNTVGAGVDTLSGFENLEGSNFNDTLHGNALANTFRGLSGSDTVYANDGSDIFYGGDGADSFWGEAGDDTLYGSLGNDTASGGQGADALWGEDGDDTFYGGTENDQLVGAAGNDTLWGEEGDDTAFGGSGNDLLVGGPGNDALWGEEGDDTLWGYAGSNYLVGGPGNDAVWGDVGNDTLWGSAGSDTLVGLVGDDTLWGEDGDDYLWGGDGNDTLMAGLGSETLRGEAGDDTLWGGSDGVDWLVGGPGNDTLWGEGGQDFFYLDSLNIGFDQIQDLVKGEDYVALNSAAFGISSLTTGGNFIAGSSPVSILAAPTILFDVNAFILSYDPDGTGPAAAVQIARTYAVLAASDFLFA